MRAEDLIARGAPVRPGAIIGYIRGRAIPLFGGGSETPLTLEDVAASIKSLTDEAAGLKDKLASGEDVSERMASIEEAVKGLVVQADAAKAAETAAAESARIQSLEDSIKSLSDSIRTAPKHKFASVSVPTDNSRGGNADAATKMWADVFTGAMDMKGGRVGIAKGTSSARAERIQNVMATLTAQGSAKALSTGGTSTGDEWVVDEVIDAFYDQVRVSSQLMQQLDEFPMSGGSNTIPVQVGGTTYHLAAESDQDDDSSNVVAASTIGTSALTMTPKKFMGETWYSAEEDEDSIIAILPRIQATLAADAAEAIEDALINGDTTASHMDSDVSAGDVRKAWKGFRKLALAAGGALNVDLGTHSPATLLSLITAMNTYGADPTKLLFIADARHQHELTGLTIGDTNSGFQQYFTAPRGGVGNLFGAGYITSGKMRTNLNASGVYDGSVTNNGAVLVVRKDRFVMGNKRSLTIKRDENIRTDQVVVVASFRKAFAPVRTPHATNEPSVVLGYNLAR